MMIMMQTKIVQEFFLLYVRAFNHGISYCDTVIEISLAVWLSDNVLVFIDSRSTSSPVNIGMGNRLWAGKQS